MAPESVGNLSSVHVVNRERRGLLFVLLGPRWGFRSRAGQIQMQSGRSGDGRMASLNNDRCGFGRLRLTFDRAACARFSALPIYANEVGGGGQN